jgi:hypothetical protein
MCPEPQDPKVHEKKAILDLDKITYEGHDLETWRKKDIGEQSQAEFGSTVGALSRLTKKPIKATYQGLVIRNSDHGPVRHLSDEEVSIMDQKQLATNFDCRIIETNSRSKHQTIRLQALLTIIVKHVLVDGFFNVQAHVRHKNKPELLEQFYADMGNGLDGYNTQQDYHISVFYADLKKLESKYRKIYHKGEHQNRTFYLGPKLKKPEPEPAPETGVVHDEPPEEITNVEAIPFGVPIETAPIETVLDSAKQEALTKFTESAGMTTTLLLQWLLIDK